MKNKARRSEDPRGRALGLQGRGALRALGGLHFWAEGLPVPAACVAQEPKWGQTWDAVLDRAVQGARSYRAPTGSQSGCRPRELTRLGEQGPWEGPGAHRREGALGSDPGGHTHRPKLCPDTPTAVQRAGWPPCRPVIRPWKQVVAGLRGAPGLGT